MDELTEMRDLSDTEIYDKAIARYLNHTHNTNVIYDRVIIFLEKEIDCYRNKIGRMEAYIEKKDTHIRELENLIEQMKVIPNARRIAAGLEPIITHEEMKNTITDDLIKAILKK